MCISGMLPSLMTDQGGFMDFATMLVMLLFTDGTTEHYVQAERNMGACMGALGGQPHGIPECLSTRRGICDEIPSAEID